MRNVFLFLAFIFLGVFAFGQVLPPSTVAAPADVPVSDFLVQVLATIKGLGGLSWVLKMAAIVTVILSSMKVSALNDLVWSHLGNFKAWAAPILGLIAGIASLSTNGNHITLAGVMAYVSAGSGAIILHELLDTIKAIPGLGSVWVQLITVISSFTGGNDSATKAS